MKLIKCHIENFGKLSDFTYDFTDGCNTVCEENGWGKSTLAAFLRVMLFGFRNEGKRDPLENERKRYSPWQKGVYGGELQFESEGKQYSVRRTFGSKSAEDEFQLTDTKTNLPCRDFTQNLGEELFRIDAGSFERTIFISQNDCETFVTDGINAKIGNLAENTDDINNFETADKRLNDLLNSMSPSRKTGSLRQSRDRMDLYYALGMNGDRVSKIYINPTEEGEMNFSMNVYVVEREFLIRMIDDAYVHGHTYFVRDLLDKQIDRLDIRGFCYDGYVVNIHDTQSYFEENMRLLQEENLNALFSPNQIYTKIRDDNPTRYINGSKAKNVMVADGCVIEGEVENSVLFRGVHVGKGAKVKNCVLMQDTVVEDNASVEYVITDKNVRVTEGKSLTGNESYQVYVSKGQVV